MGEVRAAGVLLHVGGVICAAVVVESIRWDGDVFFVRERVHFAPDTVHGDLVIEEGHISVGPIAATKLRVSKVEPDLETLVAFDRTGFPTCPYAGLGANEFDRLALWLGLHFHILH